MKELNNIKGSLRGSEDCLNRKWTSGEVVNCDVTAITTLVHVYWRLIFLFFIWGFMKGGVSQSFPSHIAYHAYIPIMARWHAMHGELKFQGSWWDFISWPSLIYQLSKINNFEFIPSVQGYSLMHFSSTSWTLRLRHKRQHGWWRKQYVLLRHGR